MYLGYHLDPYRSLSKRIILQDVDHSVTEKRYFCLGKVDGNI